MGTNYYLRQNICNECGRYDELHIGKSSAGWHFGLHIIPELNINNLNDWKKLFKIPTIQILNEYDESISVEEMMSTITERSWERDDCEDNVFNEKFYRDNYAEKGLNGLMAHTHNAIRTEGTYDLIEGDFS